MAHHQRNAHSYAPYVKQEITPQKPPGWDPAYSHSYSYDTWCKDLAHWTCSTDIAENTKASLLILQPGGLAREFAMDIDLQLTREGAAVTIDGNEIQLTGIQYVIYKIGQRFQQ